MGILAAGPVCFYREVNKQTALNNWMKWIKLQYININREMSNCIFGWSAKNVFDEEKRQFTATQNLDRSNVTENDFLHTVRTVAK